MAKIIVNNLFVGSFGFDEANIPLEVINFFKADDNGCYIYMAPRGQLGTSKDDVAAIIFVRSAFTGVVEVIGKTDKIIESYVDGLKYTNDNEKKVKVMPDEQRDVISKIKYGKHSLKEIFEKNGSGESVYVSCKVENVYIPKKSYFIALSEDYANKAMLCPENCIIMPYENNNEDKPKKLNNQSMKVIYDEKETPNQYETLKGIITNNDLWEKLSDKDKYEISKKNIVDDDNIFKVIRKQDDEVVFSNMIYYFLSKYKKSILPEFVKDVLDINIVIDKNAIVQREKNRMDISVITSNVFIIIENKIKSGVNGIKDCSVEKGKISSQLSKYYQIAQEENNSTKMNDRPIKCSILHPEYSHLNLSCYEKGEEYKQISYKKIYEFFSRITDNSQRNIPWEGSDLYYANEFKNALYKHTTVTDRAHRDELLKRLKRRIDSIEQEESKS